MDNKDGIVHDAPNDQHDPKAAAGIRSRITVVCAECKRLKLKCDRRSPCSSCVKRETTPRCVYSAAAAEKIDVQSLHNRVSVLEESWRAWTNNAPPPLPPPPPPPRPPAALIAEAADDLSSALVGLDDVCALWAAHLGLRLQSIPLRPSTPDDSDDEDDSDSPSPSSQVPISARTGVTRAHISLLPSAPVRDALWSAAERAIGPHAGLARRTRIRFEHMCSAVMGDGTLEGGMTRKKWPLSLLAVGTAGLAIGAQVVAESDGAIPLPLSTPSSTPTAPSEHSPLSSSHSPAVTHSPHPSTSAPPCARTLSALSHRALSPSAHDTDAVLAALLHAAHGTLDGRARIAPKVWPDVCRAVGVARGMGLGLERLGRTESENGEWRRRVWWEVYCADLFTSDYIGLPPSIDDTTCSAPLPRDPEDDESGDVSGRDEVDGFFAIKCRLAQLIKTLKRRLLDERPLPLDGAASMERAVSDFMKDLPLGWKLDMSTAGSGTSASGSTPGSTVFGSTPGTNGVSGSAGGIEGSEVMVQRCEIAAAAQSLILKAYHPFLKKSIMEHTSSGSTSNASTSNPASSSTNPHTSPAFASPHHAALACSSAAHTLIHAALTAHRLLPRTRPYAFAQQLFGAAVVAASVAITAPTGMLAQMALSDVRGALGVLRELDMVCALGGSGGSGRMEGVPGEAVRVVEVLVSKAEVAMGVASTVGGAKRKRGADGWGGEEGLGVGFEMPYLGTGVVTCVGDGEPEPEQHEPPPREREREATVAPAPAATPAPVPAQPLPLPLPPAAPVVPTERKEREKSREGKVKASGYPRIGVRVRNKPTKGASVGPVRSRAGSTVAGGGAGGERGAGSPVVAQGMGQNGGMPQPQPPSSIQQQQQQPIQQQQQQQQQPPSSLPQPMTVPHQPALQVITEQPTPYLGATPDYPAYQPESYQMPYLMNTPATPVRNDYQREFYGGYEYDARGTVIGMMPGGMEGMGVNGMNGMREGMREGMNGMGDGLNGMGGQEGGGDAGQQQQWYRHAAPAGQAQSQSQTQGQWNGFDLPAWGAPDPHARGNR